MRISNSKASAAIAAGESFDNHNSTLGGRTTFIGYGNVPQAYRYPGDDTRAYYVYSYDTLIAWRGQDGAWFMPPVRYSRTTSSHQTLVAQAIGYNFDVEVSLMKGHSGAYGSRQGW